MTNHCIIQGRLTRDPEVKTLDSGTTVAKFTVAWSERYKEKESKLFLDCTAWGSTGEFVERYFSKGQEIIVEGKIVQEEWADKDGVIQKRIRMSRVDRVHFCGPKRDAASPAPASAPSNDDDFVEVDDDELPF